MTTLRLLPRQALVDFAIETLNLENFNPQVQILENRLEAVGALQQAPGWQEASFLYSVNQLTRLQVEGWG